MELFSDEVKNMKELEQILQNKKEPQGIPPKF